jgi:hypothetical protein
MSNTKISALTSATTPLAGTEVLPIVQSSATKQVSVANLTAGRTQTSNGIVQGTAATGYNFTANTPASGMTSQLLNWYEEGTWTVTDASGASLSLTSNGTFYYAKVGRIVTITFNITYPVTASTANAVIGSLPFTSIAANQTSAILGSNIAIVGFKTGSTTALAFYNAANTPITNATLSGANVYGSVTYQTT